MEVVASANWLPTYLKLGDLGVQNPLLDHLLSATYSYIMIDVYYPGVFTKHTIHIGFVQQCGTGKAQWIDEHLVTQAQTVHKLLHLRLKHRDFYSTVRFMICNKDMLAEVMSCHTTFDAA